MIQVKRVKRTHKGRSRPRDRAHMRTARNHKSDTSILRRERIELIEREFKTIQGLIRRRHRRRRRFTGKTCRAHHRLHDAHMQHDFRSCPFSTFVQPFFYVFIKHSRCVKSPTLDFYRFLSETGRLVHE